MARLLPVRQPFHTPWLHPVIPPLGDFFRTNRAVTSADRERWKKEREERKARGESEKAPWTKREKRMVAICVILVILIILRYFVFKF